MDYEKKLRNFAVELFRIDAVKFGEYKTKIGLMTPVYCDLRVIISHPKLLETLGELIASKMKELQKFNVICGVPYTALPIATVVSIREDLPMVMRRKEAKDYGTRKLIEGQFKEGDQCLIVEDVVTSGSSILETVRDLKGAGLQCQDAIVLLNREQGGADFLEQNAIKMHALLSLSQLMTYLRNANCVGDEEVKKVRAYIDGTKVDASLMNKAPEHNRLKLSYKVRSTFAKNEVARQVFQLMEEKKTNLCLAADLTDATAVLNLAEQVGPHICVLKTHIDIIEEFNPNFIKALQEIAKTHNFVLFEDRKFADIGKTVEYQYSKGVFSISSWAPLVTAHALMGKGVLDGIKKCPGEKNRGVFVLAEASSSGNLIDANYTQATVKMAVEAPELVAGVVCQSPLFLDQPGLIQLTPGVQFFCTTDGLAQQYSSPESVVLEKGGDLIVVGRGITQNKDPATAAKKYKEILWKAYEQRISPLISLP